MKFSIIIPTRNRAQFLKKSFEKIREIDYPAKDFEVIVVNNGSTDDTGKVLADLKKKLKGISVSILYERRLGRSWAFKKGLSAARFSKIVSIDDDISILPDFLQQYKRCFTQYPHAAVIGGRIRAVSLGKTSNYLKLLIIFFPWIFGEVNHGSKTHALEYPNVVFAGNLVMNRDVIGKESFSNVLGRKFGGAYLYGEDFEFVLRMLLQNQLVIYCPQAVVQNSIEVIRSSFKYLVRRVFYSGVERYLVNKLLQKYGKGKVPIEPLDIHPDTLVNSIKYELLLLRIFLRLVQRVGYYLAPLLLFFAPPYEVAND